MFFKGANRSRVAGAGEREASSTETRKLCSSAFAAVRLRPRLFAAGRRFS
jgi:hypothetical protein